jgi:hypothetical protein
MESRTTAQRKLAGYKKDDRAVPCPRDQPTVRVFHPPFGSAKSILKAAAKTTLKPEAGWKAGRMREA